VVLDLPALRERGSDVCAIARVFLERFAAKQGKTGLAFTPETIRALTRHAWPGNVRELQNRVQRAVIMADGKRITVEDMELTEVADAVPAVTLREAGEATERQMVKRTLDRHSGSAAAAELGISRPTLYELMEKLGIAR
jgi:two-component system NtrC family response regulator